MGRVLPYPIHLSQSLLSFSISSLFVFTNTHRDSNSLSFSLFSLSKTFFLLDPHSSFASLPLKTSANSSCSTTSTSPFILLSHYIFTYFNFFFMWMNTHYTLQSLAFLVIRFHFKLLNQSMNKTISEFAFFLSLV